jgi:hypothetical protein
MKIKRVVLLVVFSISFFTSNAQFSIEKGNIPESFLGFNGTLLVVNIHSGKENGKGYLDAVNNILEKRFNKFYKGEFEMVEAESLSQNSYKNIKKYQFALQLIFSHQAGGTYYYKFKMIDRSNNQEVITDFYPDSTIPTYSFINSYAKALEKLRFKEKE